MRLLHTALLLIKKFNVMKRILLMMLVLAITQISFQSRIYAQCEVSNVAIELVSATEVTGGCEVVFNFSWQQEANNGNKKAFIHLWNASQYPDLEGSGLAYNNSADAPTASDLALALTTIVIDGNGSATPTIGLTYYPDPGVPVLTTGLSIVKESISTLSERVMVKGIKLIVPNCSGAGIMGDIWASQADHGQNVHCVSAGVSFIVGNPRVTGLLFCQLPRQYNVQITNIGDAPIEVSYNVYIDEGDGIYEPISHDLKITDTAVGPISLNPGDVNNSGIQSYLPWSNLKPYSDHGLWVEVSQTGTTHKTIYFISNTCIPLPVEFVGFTAQRDEGMVKLNWETASESDCYGFEIQRRSGGSDFTTVAFVASLAPSGNSQSLLHYQFSDFNPVKFVTEYRLRQKDLNGSTRYSEIRFVRGMGQTTGVLVYPNPSVNGQVNVLFDEPAKRDIALLDNTGRMIRQWRGFNGNLLQIDNLHTGSYIIQVISADTRQKITRKFQVIH